MTPRKEHRYTVADIEALPEGERAELIDGKMYLMASPTLDHQNILVWLSGEIFNYIRETAESFLPLSGCISKRMNTISSNLTFLSYVTKTSLTRRDAMVPPTG